MVCNENKIKIFIVNEVGFLRVKKRWGFIVGGVIFVELFFWEFVEDIGMIEFFFMFLIFWISCNWF